MNQRSAPLSHYFVSKRKHFRLKLLIAFVIAAIVPVFVVSSASLSQKSYLGESGEKLAHECARRGHDVCYITPGDFVFSPDDRMRVHARMVPAAKTKSRTLDKFFKDVQSVARKTKHIDVTDIDVLMLRNDPSRDATERPWAEDAGIQFGRRATERGVLVLNDPGSLSKAMNKLYFQSFPSEVRAQTLITRMPADIKEFAKQHGGVFPDSSFWQFIAGVGQVSRGCPLPHCPGAMAQRHTASRHFPLGFRWQPASLPAREGVRLVITDMCDRHLRIDSYTALQRKARPALFGLLPVQGTCLLSRLHMSPAIREPQLRAAVASIVHELEIIAFGHEGIGNRECLQPDPMPGTFIVESETRSIMSDFIKPRFDGPPEGRTLSGGSWPGRIEHGIGRISGKSVLNVHEQKFLVLLFMMQTKVGKFETFTRAGLGEQMLHPGIDMLAIGIHLFQGRARKQPPLGAIKALTNGNIIGIEQN